MLKLSKSTSNENYPISPQTSAVRKLTVRATCNTGADLYDSYLVVKNGLSTTVNGAQVVRNVGWGQVFSQKEIWEYPATCQIKYATLKIAGQVVEYNEDVNVRAVNMDVYEANHEKRRKYANTGSCGFQRLESGPKAQEPDPTVVLRSQGAYVSPFLSEPITLTGNAYVKGAATYKEVATVIYLSDIFKFCDSLDAKEVFMGGKEVVIELQFENYNQVLAEVVNYATDLTTNLNIPQPYPNQTLALTAASIRGLADSSENPPTAGALGKVFTIQTTSTYQHVNQVPLYVGQAICLWLQGALPAVVGSNVATITALAVPAAGGVCTISFVAYNAGGVYVRSPTTNAAITAAEFFANIYNAAGVCVALSGISDPIIDAAGAVNTEFTNIDAGASSTYSVNGLELVLVEMPAMAAKKNTVQFMQFMRDTDVIPQGQLNYNKSFMLDPNTVAVYCMFPPAALVAGAQQNLLSLSRHAEPIPSGANVVSEGLSYRCLLNGQQLYTRDIAFGTLTDSVEPLYYHRLTLAALNVGTTINNLSLNAPFMAMNGSTVHAMIAEPVEQSEAPQQLSVRIVFTTNAASRTIYVYKAIRREITF
jgi:hypothetical protein